MRIHYKDDASFGVAFTAEEWATMMQVIGIDQGWINKVVALSEFIETIADEATSEKETS